MFLWFFESDLHSFLGYSTRWWDSQQIHYSLSHFLMKLAGPASCRELFGAPSNATIFGKGRCIWSDSRWPDPKTSHSCPQSRCPWNCWSRCCPNRNHPQLHSNYHSLRLSSDPNFLFFGIFGMFIYGWEFVLEYDFKFLQTFNVCAYII